MADNSKIEWTEATWNPVAGCDLVSPGCTNCYAMKVAARLDAMGQATYAGLTKPSKAGPVWTGKIALVESALAKPLRWRRPRRIFVNSMSDLFHEAVPDSYIDKVFAVMALSPQHNFQVLTKRADRMREYLQKSDGARHHSAMTYAACIAATGQYNTPALDMRTWPLPNVWLGVSVEDQRRADERIPLLLDTPAAVRWISAEPLLGPVSLRWLKAWPENAPSTALKPGGVTDHLDGARRLDWVVVGGESGPDARPMHPDWARSLRDQCEAAGVPFFFKQWGAWRHMDDYMAERGLHTEEQVDGSDCQIIDRIYFVKFGKHHAGRTLDGRTHDDYPPVKR